MAFVFNHQAFFLVYSFFSVRDNVKPFVNRLSIFLVRGTSSRGTRYLCGNPLLRTSLSLFHEFFPTYPVPWVPTTLVLYAYLLLYSSGMSFISSSVDSCSSEGLVWHPKGHVINLCSLYEWFILKVQFTSFPQTFFFSCVFRFVSIVLSHFYYDSWLSHRLCTDFLVTIYIITSFFYLSNRWSGHKATRNSRCTPAIFG